MTGDAGLLARSSGDSGRRAGPSRSSVSLFPLPLSPPSRNPWRRPEPDPTPLSGPSLFPSLSAPNPAHSPSAEVDPLPSASVSAPIAAVPPLSLNQEVPSSTIQETLSAGAAAPAALPGQCMACMKRVGLMGFRCRYGETFFGPHRYPEQHGCTFDFKSAGWEAIARANLVVKAEKLDKI